MRFRILALTSLLFALTLVFSHPAKAQEEDVDQSEGTPLSLEQMDQYKNIPFTVENFEKVQNGMREEEVLSLLGKPQDMKKEHRRRNRWAFHYYYPDGYTVNFRNFLVVGKEKR